MLRVAFACFVATLLAYTFALVECVKLRVNDEIVTAPGGGYDEIVVDGEPISPNSVLTSAFRGVSNE